LPLHLKNIYAQKHGTSFLNGFAHKIYYQTQTGEMYSLPLTTDMTVFRAIGQLLTDPSFPDVKPPSETKLNEKTQNTFSLGDTKPVDAKKLHTTPLTATQDERKTVTQLTWEVTAPWGSLALKWLIGDLPAQHQHWQSASSQAFPTDPAAASHPNQPCLVAHPAQLHAVFHDAFNIKKCPALWHQTIFASIHRLLAPEGCLLTYSTARQVKDTLTDCQFSFEPTPGLGGKKAGLKAYRQN
jgi:hypothetical protein